MEEAIEEARHRIERLLETDPIDWNTDDALNDRSAQAERLSRREREVAQRGIVGASGALGPIADDRFGSAQHDAPVPPTWYDVRETPNAGQAGGDPPYTPTDYDHPISSVAGVIAPQPQLPGRGYNTNDADAKPNLMQPESPTLEKPDPYDPASMSAWEGFDAG